MSEITKEMKIMLLIDGVVSLVYMFFFLIIPETYNELTDAAHYCPITIRQVGATLLCFGICCVLAITRGEWEEIRLFFEFGMLWLLIIGIIGIFSATIYADTPAAVASNWTANIIVYILLAGSFFLYLREQKQ